MHDVSTHFANTFKKTRFLGREFMEMLKGYQPAAKPRICIYKPNQYYQKV